VWPLRLGEEKKKKKKIERNHRMKIWSALFHMSTITKTEKEKTYTIDI